LPFWATNGAHFDGSAVDRVCDILQLIVDTLLEGGIVVDFYILDMLAVTAMTKSKEHLTPQNAFIMRV
jgi:hypothetical protein